MITDYTSYEEVRAALGVTSDELEDTTLELGVYLSHLNIEFSALGSNFIAYLDARLAENYTDLNAREKLFVDLAKLYATYTVASHLGPTLSMYALKEETDSKAGYVRFNDSSKDILADIFSKLLYYRARLIELYNELNPDTIIPVSATPSVIFAAATPSQDPVTGV